MVSSYWSEVVTVLALDTTKYNAEGNVDSLRVATKSCNKQNYKYVNK